MRLLPWAWADSPPQGRAQVRPPPPPRAEPHRAVGPVVLLEDVLHAVLTTVREHHDYLVAVGAGDVGLGKGRFGSGGSWPLRGPGRGLPPPGSPGPRALLPTADSAIFPSSLVGANKAIRLDFPGVTKPGPLSVPSHPLTHPRRSRSAAGRRRTQSRPCSPWCPWPPCPARPP